MPENTETPETPTETPDTPTTLPEPIQANVIINQTIGGQIFEVNPKTTAEQVKFADGTDLNTRMAVVERAASGAAVVRFAANIAERDALTGLNPGDKVIVEDATGDPTVTKGGARYVYLPEGAGFRKTSEDESMDVICNWDHLQDKPTSTVAQIDLAVAKAHSHDNVETLAHFTDDGTGNPLYKGKRINDGKVWIANVDSLEKIPTNLADCGLVFLNTTAASGGTGETGSETPAP